ncbi:competence protein CoiA family protein [Loktanella sp. DJP18]|uniref:competence protein CoiA family protein n=1 Tax=Loktanella sp. DJP18 TaxID=3409788 RepID=UPI003BB5AFC8
MTFNHDVSATFIDMPMSCEDRAAKTLCFLPGVGGGPRTLYGRSANGNLLHVDFVETGTKGLVCPDCESEVRARKFKSDKSDHFYHLSTDECRTAGETAIHLLAKQMIADCMEVSVPHIVAENLGPGGWGSESLVNGRWLDTRDRDPSDPWPVLKLSSVRIEVYLDGIRPDLIVTDQNGRELFVEIMVTHQVDPRKKSILASRKNTTIEIDLSGLARSESADDIRSAVTYGAPRFWVYNETIAARCAIHLAEIEERQRARQRETDAARAKIANWAMLAVKRWRAKSERPPNIWSLEHYQSLANAMCRADHQDRRLLNIGPEMLNHDGANCPFTSHQDLVRLELFDLVVIQSARSALVQYRKVGSEFIYVAGRGNLLKTPDSKVWSKDDLLSFLQNRGFLKRGLKDAWGPHLLTCREISPGFAAAGNAVEDIMAELADMGCVSRVKPAGSRRYDRAVAYVLEKKFLRSLLATSTYYQP